MKRTVLYLLIVLIPTITHGQEIFNYGKALTTNRTLNAYIQTINRTTGDVAFTGGDSRGPTTPNLTFTWIWGDGTTTNGFFPQTKKYADVTKNYVAKVVSNYSNTEKDTVEVPVTFTKLQITPTPLDPNLQVYIPTNSITLSDAYHSEKLKPFPDSLFTTFTRSDLEYILSVAATIQYDFANSDVLKRNGTFKQYVLRDASFPGGYSLYATVPIAYALGDAVVKQSPNFMVITHEQGHNVTLNAPANYTTDRMSGGSGYAIHAESMANIFSYATGYELINNAQQYGLSNEVVSLLKPSYSFGVTDLRRSFNQYIEEGKPFNSWDNPATANVEISGAVSVVSYKYIDYADKQKLGFRIPTKRLMQFFQRCNSEWERRYDRTTDSPAGNSFRATLMVAALSHAFQKDLRADFRDLNFPINDIDWAFLNPALLDVSTNILSLSAIASSTTSFSVTSTATSWSATSSQSWLTPSVNSGSGNLVVTVSAAANTSITSRTAVITITAAGFVDRTVTVVQASAAPSLATSTQSLSLAATPAGSSSVSISSNTSWSVVSSQTWLTPNITTGTGSQVLSISATANPSAAPRTATLTISANGVSSQVVTITQAGAPATLTTSVASLTIDATGSTPAVNITSNTSWSVSSSQSWLTASPTSGTGNQALTLTIAANTVVDSRSATITVSANGVSNQIVSITQKGIVLTALANPLEESLRIYPNPVIDKLHIEGLPINSTILLYDPFGRLVNQARNTGATHWLSTVTMPTGVYYLQVQSGQKSAGRQVVKIP
ncbi:hypothetical protein GCM10028805_55160 [Spirosoma harenae]